MGVNRLVATLVIIGAVVLGFVILILLFVPILTVSSVPSSRSCLGYVSRLQSLAIEPNREWLRRSLGEGVADAQISDLVKQGAGWARYILKSLWSGGQALLSIFSLRGRDAGRRVLSALRLEPDGREASTSWVPLQHRETVRGLAREMDDAIAGFVRGQTAVCLILGSFYAVALT